MKKLKLIVLTVCLPALFVSAFGFAMLNQNMPNGFNRKFVQGYAQLEKACTSMFPAYYFAGLSQSRYYFRSNNPEWIIELSKDFKSSQIHHLQLDSVDKIKWSYRLQIDSPNVYLFAGALRAILTGKLTDSRLNAVYQKKQPFFTDAAAVNSQHFIIRAYDIPNRDIVFKSISADGSIRATENSLTMLKHDQGISSQGTLITSPYHPNRLFYIHRLTNNIICFDTNLNLIYRAHSVDTTYSQDLSMKTVIVGKVKKAKVDRAIKNTNYCAAVSQNAIFIYSKVRADNQSSDAPVIDVYKVEDGSYKYSFYLPGKIKSLTDLRVDGANLIAVDPSSRRIFKYQLKQVH